jgi:Lon protease-like protein
MADVAMPMFPLGAVLVPSAGLPLHVFEPRYRALVRDCLAGDHEFGVVLIERGSEVGGGDVRVSVGTLAQLVRSTELPDGRYAVHAVGIRRIRARTWLEDDPYPRADVEELVDPVPGPGLDAARTAASEAFARIRDLAARIDPSVRIEIPELPAEPVAASFELVAAAPIGPRAAQRKLELDYAGERFAPLGALLADHARLLEAHLDDGR